MITRKPKTALVVLAHPEEKSLCAAIARSHIDGLTEAGFDVVKADLHKERFDPRMEPQDLAHYRGGSPVPRAIDDEHRRIRDAELISIVFPIYWWSMPGMLKGWVDRVLTNGFAYETGPDGKVIGLLGDKRVVLLMTASGDEGGYRKHGYRQAIETQVVEGVFGFCGISKIDARLYFEVESGQDTARRADLEDAYRTGAEQ